MPYNQTAVMAGRKAETMTQRTLRDFSDSLAQPFFLQGGDHGVLLLHGFTGSAAHMRLIGEALNEQGFTVQCIQLPGHGSRMEDMRNVNWQAWLQAAKEAFLSLKERCRIVSVAGLSMGGVLALLLAEQMPVTAAIPLSAPMAVKNPLAPLARLAAPFMPVTYWKNEPKREALLDQRYNYGYPGFPTASAWDLMHLIRLTRQNLFAITCPVLVVQSHADETIDPNSAQIILNGIRSEKKAMLWLDDMPHVVTISRDHPRIAEAMGAFLREIGEPQGEPGRGGPKV
jgi:carboxylesterase